MMIVEDFEEEKSEQQPTVLEEAKMEYESIVQDQSINQMMSMTYRVTQAGARES
jgi:hypothetical protein